MRWFDLPICDRFTNRLQFWDTIDGIVFAYLILGEAPSQAQYIGGSVILGGIALSQIGLQRKPPRLMMSGNSSSQQQALENSIFKGQ